MKTLVYPGAGHTRYVDRADCPLTDAAYAALIDRLADLHVRADIQRLTVLRLRADGPVTTWDEVQALAAVRAVTDMRITWEQP